MLTILDTYDQGESYKYADLGDCDALLTILDRASVFAPWIDIRDSEEIQEKELQALLGKNKQTQYKIARQLLRIDLEGNTLYVSARSERVIGNIDEFEEAHEIVECPYNYSFMVVHHWFVEALQNFGPVVWFPTPGSIKSQGRFELWWRQGRKGELAQHRMIARPVFRPRRPVDDSPKALTEEMAFLEGIQQKLLLEM